MIENIQKFLEDIVSTIERFGKRIENLASTFFIGLLDFLERVGDWIVDVTIRIKNYLVRLFKAIGRLSIALFKLSLFYLPSVVFVLLFFFTGSGIWIVVAVIWFFVITAIGLTYGKEHSTTSADRSMEDKDEKRTDQ